MPKEEYNCTRCQRPFLQNPTIPNIRTTCGRFNCRALTQITVPSICLQCQKNFLTFSFRVARGEGRFCSGSCRAIFQNNSRIVPPDQQLWTRITKSDSCWIDTGGKDIYGYGQITVAKKQTKTHILAWWLATGNWPKPGEFICHDCPIKDNPSCVRNDTVETYIVRGVEYEKRGHLWLGNSKANQQDKGDKYFRDKLLVQ